MMLPCDHTALPTRGSGSEAIQKHGWKLAASAVKLSARSANLPQVLQVPREGRSRMAEAEHPSVTSEQQQQQQQPSDGQQRGAGTSKWRRARQQMAASGAVTSARGSERKTGAGRISSLLPDIHAPPTRLPPKSAGSPTDRAMEPTPWEQDAAPPQLGW